MGRLVLAVDPAVGVTPAAVAAAWGAEEETAALGPAAVETARAGTLLPGLLELVTIPLAVNLASSVVYDVVRRLLVRSRPKADVTDLELHLTETASGDRTMVVRLRREVS